jgi:hypothetical protein
MVTYGRKNRRLSYGRWREKCGGAAALTEANDDGGIRTVPIGTLAFYRQQNGVCSAASVGQ